MGVRQKWRMDAHDFWMAIGKFGPSVGPPEKLSCLILIAAKDSLFLTPFTHRLQIVPRMGEFGPFLAVIRSRMGVC